MTVASQLQPSLAPAPELAPSIDLDRESTSAGRLLAGVWSSRELLVILARKEFHVRYRRASFGVLWALALPLIQSLVLAVIFSRVAHIRLPSHFSYAAFVLTGMAPWTFFSMALSMASTGIVDNTELSSKVYFPRAVLPLAQVGTALYTYAITLAVVVVLCPFLGAGLGPRALLVIPGSALLIGLAVGFCLVNSALHVYFRDIRYAVSAALLVWMYVTPVIYPAADAPHVLRTLLDVNPMTGVVDLFHAGLVGHAGALMIPLLSTAAWIIVLLSAGTALHCRYDRVFADLL